MRDNNIVGVKAKQLAIKTVELYKNLSYQQHEYVMSKQILKSGTSVGANLAEAEYSQSEADYLSKRSIDIIFSTTSNENGYTFTFGILGKVFTISESTLTDYIVKAMNEQELD